MPTLWIQGRRRRSILPSLWPGGPPAPRQAADRRPQHPRHVWRWGQARRRAASLPSAVYRIGADGGAHRSSRAGDRPRRARGPGTRRWIRLRVSRSAPRSPAAAPKLLGLRRWIGGILDRPAGTCPAHGGSSFSTGFSTTGSRRASTPARAGDRGRAPQRHAAPAGSPPGARGAGSTPGLGLCGTRPRGPGPGLGAHVRATSSTCARGGSPASRRRADFRGLAHFRVRVRVQPALRRPTLTDLGHTPGGRGSRSSRP